MFREKNFALRPNGRFAVLNVGAVKTAVYEGAGYYLHVDHLPLDDDQSHAGIFGYTADDLAVAAELAVLVAPQDVHRAVSV